MTREKAARILAPETRVEALTPYMSDCEARKAAVQEACWMGARALREMADQRCIMSDRELYRLALDTYGPEAQTVMVFEEMAELQKELCKHARGARNLEAIAEEIADVLIMLEQMVVLHGCEAMVAGEKRRKLSRLEKRLKEGERGLQAAD